MFFIHTLNKKLNSKYFKLEGGYRRHCNSRGVESEVREARGKQAGEEDVYSED